jgi:hypothetical protein
VAGQFNNQINMIPQLLKYINIFLLYNSGSPTFIKARDLDIKKDTKQYLYYSRLFWTVEGPVSVFLILNVNIFHIYKLL